MVVNVILASTAIGLANGYHELGRYDETVRKFEETAELCRRIVWDEKASVVYNNLGFCLELIDKFNRSRQAYENKDGIPDSIDSDRDGDGVANVDDAYPDDGNRWEKEDKVEQSGSGIFVWVGIVILVSIITVAGVILYLLKKRKGKEVEQSSADDLGRVEKEEGEESE